MVGPRSADPAAPPYQKVVAPRKGGPEILERAEVPLSPARPGEVRVRVEAAGVLLADILWQQGAVPGGPKHPFTPGYDVVGIVEEVAMDGAESAAVAVGDRVAALIGTGGYAEHAYVKLERVVPVPDGVEPAAAAALPTSYLTAQALLRRVGQLGPGSSVLVHAAAGGTGQAMLDVARLAGLRAFGTASSAKLDIVRSYGADAIEYRSEDFVDRVLAATDGRGVDLVVDPIGGRNLDRSFAAVRRGGLVVSTAAISAVMSGESRARILWGYLRLGLRRISLSGKRGILFDVVRYYRDRGGEYQADLAHLLEEVASGGLHPVVAARYPLAQAADAQRRLLERSVAGKVVLEPLAG